MCTLLMSFLEFRVFESNYARHKNVFIYVSIFRPYVFHDLMMTLPDFVKNFFPDLPLEKCRDMLQEILKVVLYKGNT